MLQANNHMVTLDLHNTGLLNEGCDILFEGLKDNTTLKRLYLDANGISKVNGIVDYFEHKIATNTQGLECLLLSINRISTGNNIEMLCDVLSRYNQLKHLDLGSNRLTSDDVSIITNTFMHNEVLEILGLGYYLSTRDMGELPNNMGDKGAEYLAEFVRNNSSVRILEFEENGITLDGLVNIFESVQENNTLININYVQRGVKLGDMFNEVKAKLESNLTLDTTPEEYRGMKYDEFTKHIRTYKHGKNVVNIDSIYRNNM